MRREISPVCAPSSSAHAFCAPRSMRDPRRDSLTACNAVNGGAIITFLPVSPASAVESAPASAVASLTVLYIFQFPAMKGCLMCVRLLVLERDHAGELFAFQKLEGSAPARGDMCDPVRKTELVDRGH